MEVVGTVSFLPNRLPKMEFLLVGFGAVSGVEVIAADSLIAGLVGPSVAAGFASSFGITGSATTREATGLSAKHA